MCTSRTTACFHAPSGRSLRQSRGANDDEFKYSFEAGNTTLTLMRERNKSWMLRAWILSGLFYMALPGTLLGFSNLMSISAHHSLGSMPAAWMEGHGHAQLFGWISSFILGIGFYSQPARGRTAQRLQMACFGFWTSGVLLRWLANVYEWHWRPLLVISSSFEVVAVLLFLAAARHHKLPEPSEAGVPRKGVEAWMIAVLCSTAMLTAGTIFNFFECVRLAFFGAIPSFPHVLDQKYLLLLAGVFWALWYGASPHDGCPRSWRSILRGHGFCGSRWRWILPGSLSASRESSWSRPLCWLPCYRRDPGTAPV